MPPCVGTSNAHKSEWTISNNFLASQDFPTGNVSRASCLIHKSHIHGQEYLKQVDHKPAPSSTDNSTQKKRKYPKCICQLSSGVMELKQENKILVNFSMGIGSSKSFYLGNESSILVTPAPNSITLRSFSSCLYNCFPGNFH